MKTKEYRLVILGIIMILSSLLISCKAPRVTAVSCPELPGNRFNNVAVNHSLKKNRRYISSGKSNAGKHNGNIHGKHRTLKPGRPYESGVQNSVIVPDAESLSSFARAEYSGGMTASIDNTFIPERDKSPSSDLLMIIGATKQSVELFTGQPSECDTILFKSGSRLTGKVEEIGLSEIKYRKCDNLNGPVFLVLKSEVAMIKFSNGTREAFTSDSPIYTSVAVQTIYPPAPPKTEGLAIAGFVSSLAGLFIAGIPLGLIGVIFGGISLGKMKKEPGKYKGKGLAISSIVIGIIAILGAIVVISSL